MCICTVINILFLLSFFTSWTVLSLAHQVGLNRQYHKKIVDFIVGYRVRCKISGKRTNTHWATAVYLTLLNLTNCIRWLNHNYAHFRYEILEIQKRVSPLRSPIQLMSEWSWVPGFLIHPTLSLLITMSLAHLCSYEWRWWRPQLVHRKW